MFLALMLLWVVLNGRVTVEILLTGAVLSAGLCWFAARYCGVTLRAQGLFFKHIGEIILYLVGLLGDIVVSSLLVCGMILNPFYHIRPRLFFLDTHLKTDAARTALANSVTLTPGTISHSLHGSILYIHALDLRFEFGDLEKNHNVRLYRLEQETQKEARP